MPTLWFTDFERDKIINAVRAVRNARRDTDSSIDMGVSSIKAEIERFAADGKPFVITEHQDDDLLKRTGEGLAVQGVSSKLAEDDQPVEADPQPQPEVEGSSPAVDEKNPPPSYDACKIALVMLAHTDGNPGVAMSALQAQHRVLTPRPEAEIMSEASRVMLDVFSFNPQRAA